MRQWMGEEELNLRITTSWEEGSGIQMTGFHHEPFVNDGIVLKARKPSELSYTHRSSISNLPEVPSSYCIFTFKLLSLENGSQLQLTIAQFPTESIFLHLQLYWNVTLKFIKVQAEKQTHEQ